MDLTAERYKENEVVWGLLRARTDEISRCLA
jgi:hypothetical protein